MKKLIILALVLVLCASLSLTAFAGEYVILDNGQAQYDTAVGYVFDIRAVNDKITGEDAVIMTSNEHTGKTGTWSCWVIAEEIDDSGIYRAIKNAEAMQGAAPEITLDPGQIYIVVHSATSKPDEAAEKNYHNWEDKVAFLAVKAGDCFVFDGVDLENGTCTNGKMLCVSEEDVLAGIIEWPDGTETSEPETSTPETSAPVESTPETSEPADMSAEEESKSGSENATGNASAAESSTTEIIDDSEVVSSTIEIDGESEGLGVWLWVIIGAAVVVVVIVVVMLAKKK